MVRTREVIPGPLQHALLATRVLAVLYALDKSLGTPIFRTTMEDASGFLHAIIEGRRYTKERVVKDKSYALAYGEAIRAIEMLPTQDAPSGGVGDLLSDLLATAESLKSGKEVSPVQVKRLTVFFTRLRTVATDTDTKPIETISTSK